MKFSKFGVSIIILICIFSIFIAKISNIITVSSTINEFVTGESHYIEDKYIIAKSNNNLIWFVQISDLHLSIFHDYSRITEFKEFCDITIDVIKPMVVLASGDLTDAQMKNDIGSSQFEDEWKHYRSTLDKCGVQKKTVWLDIRGNHDNFDVLGPHEKENYYRNYSIQGGKHSKSYLHKITDKYGNIYSFIAIDACLNMGPRRPFNFMGILSKIELENIKKMAESAAANSNSTIWFGHYPTSCILTAGSDDALRSMIGKSGIAYLCGHLHTAGGFVKRMYTLQKSGYLELELADWKRSRKFRVIAIDNGIFSFVDVKHRNWPIILVTNPKDSLFSVPSKEPLHRIRSSTHIRILAFSPDRISSIKINFGNRTWADCEHSEGPLYVLPWNPADFKKGLHQFEVRVTDAIGRESTVTHTFSLDGSKTSFPFISRFFLMVDFNDMFHLVFGVSVIFNILPLCILRCISCSKSAKYIYSFKQNESIGKKIIRKMCILSNVDILFYSLIFYPLYVSVGPWSVGEIIKEHYGVIFVWGIFVNGGYLPGSFTYAYGAVQMAFFSFPLMLHLAFQLERRLKNNLKSRNWIISWLLCLWRNILFIGIILMQLHFAYSFWLEYGSMAVFIGPIRLWSIIYAILLTYYAQTIPVEKIKCSTFYRFNMNTDFLNVISVNLDDNKLDTNHVEEKYNVENIAAISFNKTENRLSKLNF